MLKINNLHATVVKKSIFKALLTILALTASGLANAQPVDPAPPVAVPNPIPDPLSPEYAKLITDLGGQIIDNVREGYRNCMANAMYNYAKANAPGGNMASFKPPANMAARDAMTNAIIAACAEGRAKLLAELDADVAKREPFGASLKQFVDLARTEFETMDQELRDNLRNAEPKPTK